MTVKTGTWKLLVTLTIDFCFLKEITRGFWLFGIFLLLFGVFLLLCSGFGWLFLFVLVLVWFTVRLLSMNIRPFLFCKTICDFLWKGDEQVS